jgi:hypothetical protein
MPILFPLLAFAFAAADCPAKIEVRQTLAEQITGWLIGYDAAPHLLSGMTFFDGKPEEMASLVPDSQSVSGGKNVAVWTFGAIGRPVWIACHYAGTGIILQRALPKNTRSCSITYSSRETIAGLPVIEKVDCK